MLSRMIEINRIFSITSSIPLYSYNTNIEIIDARSKLPTIFHILDSKVLAKFLRDLSSENEREKFILSHYNHFTYAIFGVFNESEVIGFTILGPYIIDGEFEIIKRKIDLEKNITVNDKITLKKSIDSVPIKSINDLREITRAYITMQMSSSNLFNMTAINQSQTNKNISLNSIHNIKNATKQISFDIFTYNKELLKYLKSGNKDILQEFLYTMLNDTYRDNLEKDYSYNLGYFAILYNLHYFFFSLLTSEYMYENSLFNAYYDFLMRVTNNTSKTDLTIVYDELLDFMLLHYKRLNECNHHYAIRDLIDYIDNNLDKKLTLKSLSSKFGYSYNYLSKLFYKVTNEKFTKHVTFKRIERAKELLSTTYLPLQEIAMLLGYNYESHFSMVFKKEIGVTPLQFRKNKLKSILR